MFELEKASNNDYKAIKELYENAFPKEERLPFRIMKRRSKKGNGTIFVAKDNGRFIGFISIIEYEDLIYLFYFAVEEEFRGLGYGSKIIRSVLDKYHDKRVFLARETLDEKADNYNQRVLRHNFYIKNGLVDLPHHIQEATVVYDIMGNGNVISADDYDKLMAAWGNRLLNIIIPLRIIED